MVAAGVADKVMIQVAYAIGVAQPVGLYVNTYGTATVKDKKGSILTDGVIAEKISKVFDMRPYSIVERFGLKNPIYQPTASYGHFGRDFYTKEVEVFYPVKGSKPTKVNGNGKEVFLKKVDFFAWEKLDFVDKVKKSVRDLMVFPMTFPRFILLFSLLLYSVAAEAQIKLKTYTSATDTFYWKRYTHFAKPAKLGLARLSASNAGIIASFLAKNLDKFRSSPTIQCQSIP